MTAEQKEYHRIYYAKNKARWVLSPEKKAEKIKRDRSRKAYYAEYRKKTRAQAAAWREANRAKQRKWARGFYAANKEKLSRQSREYKARHPEKVNASIQRRNAVKRSLLHPELDRGKVVGLMAQCRQKTYETGEKHQLDHIIPLDVGGWHHQDNLQVLPARLNASKSNNPMWEVPGYKCWRDVPVKLWPLSLVMFYYDLLIG